MQKVDQLMIRACKSDNPYQRVQSVYRRFYAHAQANQNLNIARVLSSIADKYLALRVSELLNALHPENRIFYGASQDDDHWTATVKLLISKIMTTPTSQLPGLTHPRRFRTFLPEPA